MECPYEESMKCPYIDTSTMIREKTCKECSYYKLYRFREEAFRYVK